MIRRILTYAACALAATAAGDVLDWAEGLGWQITNATTWALALFTGMLMGSLIERAWLSARPAQDTPPREPPPGTGA
jgi:hypothetical protein